MFFRKFLFILKKSNRKKNASVRLITRVKKDKILLRWGVDRALEWYKANKYGFFVERYTIKRNGSILNSPEKKLLTPNPLKARPLGEWEELAKTNNHAAIIAQAIYGESFEVGGKEGALAKIINRVQEIEQRFSFALLSADMSFEASKMAGWGLEDATAKKGEEYLYRVSVAIPEGKKESIDQGISLASIDDYEPLPKPIDLNAIFGDKHVVLTWEYILLKDTYVAYYLEKSRNGIDFTQVGETPIVNMNDKEGAPAKRMYYIDSLAQNNTKYHYRVYGISTFGEKGPRSDIVFGEGKKALTYTPKIINHKINEDNSANIYWEFPEEGTKQVRGFELSRSNTGTGLFIPVIKDIPSNQREIVYSNLEPSNYFIITAIGDDDIKKSSFPILVQLEDSIPPISPVGLKGEIDSSGVVRISWKPNTEPDLLGYRVYRGNLKHEEYALITADPIKRTTFTDSVKVKSLNPEAFYLVVAIDQRFNHSDYSDTLSLKKPDIVPPSSPVFETFSIEEGNITVKWIPSTSEDASVHKLFRKNLSDNLAWRELLSVSDTTSIYIDADVENKKTYRYAILALDESGLESKPTSPLTITMVDTRPRDIIRNFRASANRKEGFIELSWRMDEGVYIRGFTIYKESKGEAASIWRQLPANINRLVDKEINPNTTYTYYIKSMLRDASYSKVKTAKVYY